MSNSTQQLKAQQRRKQFSELLRDMFQLNQPELDFGLYRIMHARKDDINRFIERDLPRITQQAFKGFATQDKTQIQQELDKAILGAQALEVDPDTLPKVQELKAKLSDNFDLAREEGDVYDALITFFNRYYSEGDFLSRRVYKDGTYAIPYQGEEVVLHWANKDQYYIKSSKSFQDYSFRLNPNAQTGEDPQRVHFKLVDAAPDAKDNNKESADSKRVFVLDRETPFELIEGEANEQGDTFPELELRFYFRAATAEDWTEDAKKSASTAAAKKPPAQDHLRAIVVDSLLDAESPLPEEWKTLLAQPYTKADGEQADYSLLRGQLNNYTKGNTFDYFIHKDLGGFLTRELDFYIKNELLDWADIASLKNDTARLAPLLSKIEVIRSLGEKIIAFLAQLENFQKKLWLKKKFVTETNYCITLDRLEDHTELLKLVLSNQKQRDDWASLYALDLEQLDKDYESLNWEEFLALPQYRYLMLDTAHFGANFKAQLLATMDDLDQQCDGLLINSDNLQALNLLADRYRKEATSIYIDPPYNSDASAIIYKNGYKDSSWLSLIQDRLVASKTYMADDSIICVAIDDAEYHSLKEVLDVNYEKCVGVAVVKSNPQSRKTSGRFSPVHEYALFYGNSSKSVPGSVGSGSGKEARYPLVDDQGRYAWMNFIRAGTNDLRIDRPKSFYPIVVSNDDKLRIPQMTWNDETQSYDLSEEIFDTETLVYPIKTDNGKIIEKRWQRGHVRVASELDEYRVRRDSIGNISIDFKTRMDADAAPTTWWEKKDYASSNYGAAELKAIFGDSDFDFPKAKGLVSDCLKAAGLTAQDGLVLDYFGGSGTTAQAVMELNKQDGGSRKYILVEMGGHCSNVIKPRIQRIAYSNQWKAGSPVLENELVSGSLSHSFKYMALEGYEDALGNLALNRPAGQQQLVEQPNDSKHDNARQSYVMNYMLNVETRGSQSLLNTQQFLDPSRYELKVRSASGDETKTVHVDLLETFNYLLGLTVEHIAAPIHFDADFSQGEFGRWQAKVKRTTNGKWWFRTVFGTNRNGQKVLVVWRNLPGVIAGESNGLQHDNAVLDAVLIEKLAIRLTESLDDEVDILYVNGDHNIAIPRNRKGQPMEQARLQLIEEAFHRLMFAGTETVQ